MNISESFYLSVVGNFLSFLGHDVFLGLWGTRRIIQPLYYTKNSTSSLTHVKFDSRQGIMHSRLPLKLYKIDDKKTVRSRLSILFPALTKQVKTGIFSFHTVGYSILSILGFECKICSFYKEVLAGKVFGGYTWSESD